MPARFTNILTKRYYYEKRFRLEKSCPPPFLTLFFAVLVLLIASCNDSVIPEVELPEQSSLDTPESYVKAIAKAQANLFTHASNAMREMDEEEFKKVMRNAEKVIQRSPVFESISITDGDFEVRKFSEEEYMMQVEWHEENQDDFLDALSPIISPEYLMEIETLTIEFFTVYGGAEVDTTGWREIMHRASQDAFAQETGSLSCNSPQQITVNQASILPVPSIATIMGWFGGNGIEEVGPCKSCCIECCGCKNECHEGGFRRFGDAYWGSAGTLFTCIVYGGWSGGPISWGGCGVTAMTAGNILFLRAVWFAFRCDGNCRENPACKQCPAGIDEWWAGTDCSTADRW